MEHSDGNGSQYKNYVLFNPYVSPSYSNQVSLRYFQRTTATTITIEIVEPSKPNGYIEKYKIYLNGREVSSQLSVKSTN